MAAVFSVQHPVTVAVHMGHCLCERLQKFLHGDARTAILIEVLKAADHLLVHELQPQRLKFFQGQIAVFVAIMFGQQVFARCVQLILGQFIIRVRVEPLHHSFEAVALIAVVAAMLAGMFSMMFLAVILVMFAVPHMLLVISITVSGLGRISKTRHAKCRHRAGKQGCLQSVSHLISPLAGSRKQLPAEPIY